MKFMATWQVQEDKRHETLKAFSQMTAADDEADTGDKVKLIGRWHDVAGFTGVAIFETDDPKAIPAWLLNWNHSIDIEVTPVLDDEETRAVGKSRFGS
jgi:hypothetical protein